MTELTLISVAEGPDVHAQDPIEDGRFQNLMADEVVLEWLEGLADEQPVAAQAG